MTTLFKEFGELTGGGGQPLYLQLQKIIRDAIESGRLGPRDALPAERDIALALAVSRVTVRRALAGLEAEGLLARKRGAGTFVAARIEKPFARITSFSEDMKSRGWIAGNEWLERGTRRATPDDCMGLGLSPGAKVYALRRIRFADGVPMALETTILPLFALNTIDDLGTSLYAALTVTGYRPVRALQRLRAVIASIDDASHMALEAGDPMLEIKRRGFLADDRVIELTTSLYRGDTYDFVAELTA